MTEIIKEGNIVYMKDEVKEEVTQSTIDALRDRLANIDINLSDLTQKKAEVTVMIDTALSLNPELV